MDEHLPLAMDVVCDLAVNPLFDAAELEKEKGVVLEEISMSEDTPEDLAHELLMLAHYGDQPVARPILGSAEQISAYTRDDLAAYWGAKYHPQNAVLSIAGNYDWAARAADDRRKAGRMERGRITAPAVTRRSPQRRVAWRRIRKSSRCISASAFPG